MIQKIDHTSPLAVIFRSPELFTKMSDKDLVPRRIRELPDKEGKVRLVAIGDYWTQAILRPIHDALAKCLKTLYCDCTFNQDHFKDAIDPEFSGMNYYSIDLKHATELMPATWQADVLEWISGSKDIGDLWLKIMTGFD